MATAFTWFITLQFLIILGHDLIDVPGWIHGSQVQAQIGKTKVWLASLVNAVFPGIAVGLALSFWHRPKPVAVPNYWAIYCGVALLSAIGMWYVPYFKGAPEKLKQSYLEMYAGTKQILPARGRNPRPNAFHIALHALFVVTFCLAIALRSQR